MPQCANVIYRPTVDFLLHIHTAQPHATGLDRTNSARSAMSCWGHVANNIGPGTALHSVLKNVHTCSLFHLHTSESLQLSARHSVSTFTFNTDGNTLSVDQALKKSVIGLAASSSVATLQFFLAAVMFSLPSRASANKASCANMSFKPISTILLSATAA